MLLTLITDYVSNKEPLSTPDNKGCTSPYRRQGRAIKALLLAIALAFTLAHPAFAQTPESASEKPRTAVIADDEAGVLHFMIDGREMMRLDADGLRVRGDVKYGRRIIDAGDTVLDDETSDQASTMRGKEAGNGE